MIDFLETAGSPRSSRQRAPLQEGAGQADEPGAAVGKNHFKTYYVTNNSPKYRPLHSHSQSLHPPYITCMDSSSLNLGKTRL